MSLFCYFPHFLLIARVHIRIFLSFGSPTICSFVCFILQHNYRSMFSYSKFNNDTIYIFYVLEHFVPIEESGKKNSVSFLRSLIGFYLLIFLDICVYIRLETFDFLIRPFLKLIEKHPLI